MQPRNVALAAVAALAMTLAGCTGSFNIDQTEPIRVQLEGAPEKVTVKEDDAQAKTVIVENPDNVETVEVEVEVTQISVQTARIKIMVQDPDTGEVLAETEVDVGDNVTQTTTTTQTVTTTVTTGTTTTQTSTQGAVVIENLIVNVKGKDNFVVITQALEGEAEVNIAARGADGNVQGNDGTSTGTSTMTTSTSNSTTY